MLEIWIIHNGEYNISSNVCIFADLQNIFKLLSKSSITTS